VRDFAGVGHVKTKAQSKSEGLSIIHPFAAGIDIGSPLHVAASAARRL